MTLIEVLMVLAALMLLAAAILPALPHRNPPIAKRIQCINNLKQIGLATRVWEGDNNDKYPTAVSVTNGGAMEDMTGFNAWRNYQVMSNELSTPKVLLCPADDDRSRAATNFNSDFSDNSHISFFVGVDADETNVQSILSGDRNLTNGTAVKNGFLKLSAGQPIRWTTQMHNKAGNIVLADGSVQQISSVGLQNAVATSGYSTNRLLMPVLGP